MGNVTINESKWVNGSGYSYTTTLDCIEVDDNDTLQEVVNAYALDMVENQYNADGTTIVEEDGEEDIQLTAEDEYGNTATAWLSEFVKQVKRI